MSWLHLVLVAIALAPVGCRDEGRSAVRSTAGPKGERVVPVQPPPWMRERIGPPRILVVSSYHREYLWSEDTNRGLCAGLIELGYLSGHDEAARLTRDDALETDRVVLRKLWMDTKRKSSEEEIAEAAATVLAVVGEFDPHLVLLGDDNAANYVGNQLLDSDVPVVFWGINGIPLKYGLLDSLDAPGHNVTGVYQAGYLVECLEFLKRIVPAIRTFGILSDDSETGRAKVSELHQLASRGDLPVELVGTVVTNCAARWKAEALELAGRADAFFVLNHNTLTDEGGLPVDQLELGAWYLRNVRRPDCGHEKQFAQEGLLATCDDSGFNQALDAARIADRILRERVDPARIPVRAPRRGPYIANRERASMLGLELQDGMGIEEYVDRCLALERHPD